MQRPILCVGGPYSGCIADINEHPRHGYKMPINDWAIGPGTIPPVAAFSEELSSQHIKSYDYTFVLFNGDGQERWFLAYGTESGLWVLDELTQMARRRTLGDKA